MSFWDGARWVPLTRPPGSTTTRRRTRDWIATLVMLIGVAVLILPKDPIEAAAALLTAVPDTVESGSVVRISGHNFPPRSTVQMAWDGSTGLQPTAKVGGNGTFKVRMFVDAPIVGEHTVSALMAPTTLGRSVSGTMQVVASVVVTVVATETPAPTATATVAATASPTASPTAEPTPRPTPVVTPAPTAVPPTPAPPTPAPPPPPPPTGRPQMPAGATWSDQFNGTALNGSNWWRDTLFDGQITTFARWGQFSSDPRLYSVHDSMLTMKALRVSGERAPYLAPQLSTRGLRSFGGYGIYRASIRYDRGHALWPAVWTLDPFGLGRELDLIEAYPEPSDPTNYQVTIHADGNVQQGTNEHNAPDFETAFHVFELEWRPNVLIARRDGVEQHRFNMTVPNTEAFILLTLAVGVHWRNMPPDATTPTNPKMDIDWVGYWPL